MKTIINGTKVAHVNAETGEIICETEDRTIISDGQLTSSEKAFKEHIEKYQDDFNEDQPFVKCFTNISLQLVKQLSPIECKILIALTSFVCYEDCMIRQDGRINRDILSVQDLAKILNMKYDTLQRIIRSLNIKGVLAILKVGAGDGSKKTKKALIVNPYIYVRGTSVKRTTLSMFDSTIWHVE